jgi:hypothetical protein
MYEECLRIFYKTQIYVFEAASPWNYNVERPLGRPYARNVRYIMYVSPLQTFCLYLS